MILLLGSTGYLGQAFADELRQRALPFVPLTRKALDYSRFELLFSFVRAQKPTFIINAAGHTGRPTSEACEHERAQTVQANTLLPQTVARVAYLTKTPWGHISSGSIYSGAKVKSNGHFHIERDFRLPEIHELFSRNPDCFHGFIESDEPNFSFRAQPCSFYSGTKALAEEGLHWFSQGYIWRPGPVFDHVDHPRNLLSQLAYHRDVQHSLGSLSHRGDFVRACLDLWERRAPFGTYHVANSGVVTGEDVLRHIKAEAKLTAAPGKSTGDGWAHNAPVQCILDTAKLRGVGIELRSAHEALKACIP